MEPRIPGLLNIDSHLFGIGSFIIFFFTFETQCFKSFRGMY